ncbi:MAG: EAL domain-containing protein [Gammaproteobacteria bacterium]|nr:EAL domain-containing protein [Gammaproteobacteria bacterium]
MNQIETGSNKPQILIADDDRSMCESVIMLLREHGYACEGVNGGRQAIAWMVNRKVDLLLLDLNMPEINGMEVMNWQQTNRPDVDVVVVSSETTFDNAVKVMKNGVQEFLRKPYAPEELLKVIKNALQTRKLRLEVEETQRLLTVSERRNRFIVSNSPDIIYMLNKEGKFTFVNERVTELMGFSTNELIGKHFASLIHEEDIEKAHFAFAERRTGSRASRNVELRLCCKNKERASRHFMTSNITIELNAVGIYSSPTDSIRHLGTYGVARDITERKLADEIIQHQLHHDFLTDLPNRTLFRDRLDLAISYAKRSNTKLAVMYLDMDRFKIINDSLGHLAGDQLLQIMATRLHNCLRDSDTLARVGGDEFNMIIPDIVRHKDAAMIAEKIFEHVREPILLDGQSIVASFSIGISMYPDDGTSIDTLVKNADMAMYHIKGKGKNDYEFYSDSMKAIFSKHLSLEQGLRTALKEDQFEIVFQPQWNLQEEKLCGFEALVRWNHPENGTIMPDDFIPLAEEVGLIVELGQWVMNAACHEFTQHILPITDGITLAVNISTAQLQQTSFESMVLSALKSSGMPAKYLELEITENLLMQDIDLVISKLKNLTSHGISIAVDDFGTGYSSLGYLHALPLHTLKIDRSFLSTITTHDSYNEIVTAIIAMAKELHLDIIAEGVETDVQLSYLKRLGCPKAQGYLLGSPENSIRTATELGGKTQESLKLGVA